MSTQAVARVTTAAIPSSLLERAKAKTNDSCETHVFIPASFEETDRAAGRQWLVIVVLCCLVSIICSIDRAAMSVTLLPMSTEFGWNDGVKGAIGGAFNLGYTVTNLYGGYMSTVWSAHKVLGLGVVVWSLFTLATPVAAGMSHALWPLLLVRMVMGSGEGVAFPAIQSLINSWVVKEKRSRCLVLVYSGHQLGTILSLLLSPLIISYTGWRAVFYVYGALGLLWMILWQPAVPNQNFPRITSVQKLVEREASKVTLSQLPWRQFLTNRPFLAIMASHATFGMGYNMCIVWLPTYFNQQFGLNVKQSSFLSILPWVVMAATTNLSGWIADSLVNSKAMPTTSARKLLQTIGSVGPATCLLYLSTAERGEMSVRLAVGLLTSTTGLLGLQAAGFASNHQDLSNRYAPMLFGMSNAMSSLLGSVSVYLTGVLLQYTASWSVVFKLTAGCYLGSALMYSCWASSEPQFDHL